MTRLQAVDDSDSQFSPASPLTYGKPSPYELIVREDARDIALFCSTARLAPDPNDPRKGFVLSRKYIKLVKVTGGVVASAEARDHQAVESIVSRGVEIEYRELKDASKQNADAVVACIEAVLAQPPS